MDLDGDTAINAVIALVVAFLVYQCIEMAKGPPGKAVPRSTKPKAKAAATAKPEGTEFTMEQVAEHKSDDDMWMVIDGKVYDVTNFADAHPGGSGFVTRNAGKDASTLFKGAGHSPHAMSMLTDPKVEPTITLLGDLKVDATAILAKCFNTAEIEAEAVKVIDSGALAYYRAGAEDNNTIAENERVWSDYLLRPRMFVDVTEVDLSTTLLGKHRLELPIMAAPTALLKMAHEEGECGVARACKSAGVGNCLSTTASMSIEEVAEAAPDCYRWFQLYVYRDLEKTKSLVQRADKAGYSAIVLTVDLPVLGNRTSLQKIGFKVPKEFKMANMTSEKTTKEDESAAKDGVSVKDPGDRKAYIKKLYSQNMSLELVGWLGTITKLPIIIKGILRGEDAARAAAYPNVQGIIVSNHGGRQLDGEIAPLTALTEVKPWIDLVNAERRQAGIAEVDLIVDGGVRKGRDIVKAMALGAKAVMVGRSLIYGLGLGGTAGVEKVFSLFKEEMQTCMQLAGIQSTDQIDGSFVIPRPNAMEHALQRVKLNEIPRTFPMQPDRRLEGDASDSKEDKKAPTKKKKK